jgi:large subunit ribosomal protein L4
MKTNVITWDNKASGDIELDDTIFALPVRQDLLHRVVEWQRAKKRAGTHATKTITQVSGTTAKPWRQKGTGRARQGSARSVQFRGGGISHGPVVRSHAYDLPKKVRKLGLKIALSAKAAAGELVVVENNTLSSPKAKPMAQQFSAFGWRSALVIDGPAVDTNFMLAVRNLKGVDVLPVQGANVLDILRHDRLVLTRAAVDALKERLA